MTLGQPRAVTSRAAIAAKESSDQTRLSRRLVEAVSQFAGGRYADAAFADHNDSRFARWLLLGLRRNGAAAGKDLKAVYLNFITAFFETDQLQLRFLARSASELCDQIERFGLFLRMVTNQPLNASQRGFSLWLGVGLLVVGAWVIGPTAPKAISAPIPTAVARCCTTAARSRGCRRARPSTPRRRPPR